ncbi:uncharacterized protein F5891DRAFT_951257 [Suillus fuscotomentosus]|uniref:Uncharacterized protein n=1 Tax=Suillus fuscotomentosus TaxID=1912939 RepID=A0AAD4HLM0_9AGAM|nr:uncharacterized protein F5891DRAFT_951257 [Suillus fuscotomentosus]KAG1900987.1 hypothetical protein F5891DRAFT_951257 [Suillus fuscotomentosus]
MTGLIGFEAATITPIWECAVIPRWLPDTVDAESSYEGRPSKVRSVSFFRLQKFPTAIPSGKGVRHGTGHPF